MYTEPIFFSSSLPLASLWDSLKSPYQAACFHSPGRSSVIWNTYIIQMMPSSKPFPEFDDPGTPSSFLWLLKTALPIPLTQAHLHGFLFPPSLTACPGLLSLSQTLPVPHAHETHPFLRVRGKRAETQLLENTVGLFESHFLAPRPGWWGSRNPEKRNDLAKVTHLCMEE